MCALLAFGPLFHALCVARWWCPGDVCHVLFVAIFNILCLCGSYSCEISVSGTAQIAKRLICAKRLGFPTIPTKKKLPRNDFGDFDVKHQSVPTFLVGVVLVLQVLESERAEYGFEEHIFKHQAR